MIGRIVVLVSSVNYFEVESDCQVILDYNVEDTIQLR